MTSPVFWHTAFDRRARPDRHRRAAFCRLFAASTLATCSTAPRIPTDTTLRSPLHGDTRPRVARRIALLVVTLVPIAAWPGIGDPFVTLRTAILAAGTAAVVLLLAAAHVAWTVPPRFVRAAGVWVAALGLSSAFAPLVSLGTLLQELLVVLWAAALAWSHCPGGEVAVALRRAALVVAAWALLQWAGADPWSIGGWHVTGDYGPRMRVYGPLGNPNYVGAFLSAAFPLALASAIETRFRIADAGAAALIALGIVATGSRGAWLGVAAGAAWLGFGSAAHGRRVVLLSLGAVAAIGVGVAFGPARGIAETVRGRAYIWTVAAPHLLVHPSTGWGPGSFAVSYPAWERERIEQGVDRDVRTYATAQTHAHNDYIERLSDLGVPGLAAWVILLAVVLRTRDADRASAPAVAAAAGVAALAAVSMVDFPLQRPVERFTWWTLAVLAAGSRAGDSGEMDR